MDLRFAGQLVAGTMTAGCVVPYVRGIRRGEVKPQRTSWLVFSSLAVVGTVAQLAQGSTAGALLSLGSCLGFSVVFAYSWRRGVGGAGPADLASIVLLIAGLLGWWLTTEPLVGVVAVILAEAPAVALTAAKARRQPESEALPTWVIDCAAGTLAVGCVPLISVDELLYPIYHFLANGTVVAAILVGRGRLRPASRAHLRCRRSRRHRNAT